MGWEKYGSQTSGQRTPHMWDIAPIRLEVAPQKLTYWTLREYPDARNLQNNDSKWKSRFRRCTANDAVRLHDAGEKQVAQLGSNINIIALLYNHLQIAATDKYSINILKDFNGFAPLNRIASHIGARRHIPIAQWEWARYLLPEESWSSNHKNNMEWEMKYRNLQEIRHTL